MGKTKLGNYAKFMSIADTSGLPLAVHKASARAHEVALAQVPSIKLSPWEDSGELLGIMPMPVIRWITRLHNKGLSLLRPIGENEDVPPLRSVAPLHRYRRHWKIESLFSWLNTEREL